MSPGNIARIKSATRATIAVIGGLAVAAKLPGVRVSISRLAQYQSDNHPNDVIPLDIAAALDAASGEFGITKVLAAILGGEFVATENAAPAESIDDALAALAKEVGATMADVIEANADKKFSAAECRRALKHITELKRDIARLEAAIARA